MASNSVKLPLGFVMDSTEPEASGLPDGFVMDADNKGGQSQERNLEGFIGNLISSGKKLATDTAGAISGLGRFAAGVPADPIGSAKEAGGFIADLPGNLAETYKEKYGGWDNFTKTLYEDPVGVITDLSMFLGGGSAALRGASVVGKSSKLAKAAEVAGKASALTDPLSVATKGVGAGINAVKKPVSEALKRSAAGNYMDVILPSRKMAVPAAEKTAQQMADAKIVATTRKAMQDKMVSGKSEWGPKASHAFDNAAPIPIGDAADVLEKVKENFLYVKGTNQIPANRSSLDKFFKGVEEDLIGLADQNGNIPATIFDNYIDDINKGLVGANQDYRISLAPKTAKSMEKAVAGAYRNLLDTPNPTAAGINATYSMYAKGWQFMEDFRRSKVTSKSGLQTGSSKGFGALVERSLPKYVRNIPKNIAGIFDSVPWNTVSGAIKSGIADALANGRWAKAESLMRRYVYVPGVAAAKLKASSE